jgi:thiol-disulfide isomerase/thioredoxin
MQLPSDAQPDEIFARLRGVVAMLEKMERDFPKAPQLHDARVRGFLSAVQLARRTKDPAMAAKAEQIGQRIVASNAPQENKVMTAAHLALLKLQPVGNAAATIPAEGAAKIIREFVSRHGKDPEQGPDALAIAIKMADGVEQFALSDELLAELVKDFPDSPQARSMTFWTGKPFKITLTRLDGAKLSLPDDLLGKVVVVDFWATWCGPAIVELPKLKKTYGKYRDKGVEFVGISLDRDKGVLEDFVKSQGIGWIQTFSGKATDPAAEQFQVESIPRQFVVGKDGRIITDAARGKLEWELDKAAGASGREPQSPVRAIGDPRPATAPAAGK